MYQTLFFKKEGKKKGGKETEEETMPKSKTKQKKSNVLCFLFWIGFGVQKLRTQRYKTRVGCQF